MPEHQHSWVESWEKVGQQDVMVLRCDCGTTVVRVPGPKRWRHG